MSITHRHPQEFKNNLAIYLGALNTNFLFILLLKFYLKAKRIFFKLPNFFHHTYLNPLEGIEICKNSTGNLII